MRHPFKALLPIALLSLPLPVAATCLQDVVDLAERAGISLAPPYAQAEAQSPVPPTIPATAESQGFVEDDTAPMEEAGRTPDAGSAAAEPLPQSANVDDPATQEGGVTLASRLLRSAMEAAEAGDADRCQLLLAEAEGIVEAGAGEDAAAEAGD